MEEKVANFQNFSRFVHKVIHFEPYMDEEEINNELHELYIAYRESIGLASHLHTKLEILQWILEGYRPYKSPYYFKIYLKFERYRKRNNRHIKMKHYRETCILDFRTAPQDELIYASLCASLFICDLLALWLHKRSK